MENLKPVHVKLQGSEKFLRVLGGPPDTAGMKAGYVTLLPGQAVGLHRTSGKEEAVVILEGCASVYCGAALFCAAEKGSVVYIPPETDHDIRNEGALVLRYLYVVAPA